MKDGKLEITDAPMFGRVMRDEGICKAVLECILGIEVERIEYLNAEQAFDPAVDAKGVRMDVFAKGSGHAFDIEMQTGRFEGLGRRMRYYQSSMDTALLDRGEDYSALAESFIIFICTADPYKHGLPVYHLERVCVEDDGVDAGDASHWLVLNAQAWAHDVDVARSALLEYVSCGSVGLDGLTGRIDAAVREGNADAAWRERAMGFMTLEHHYAAQMKYATKAGLEQGMKQGLEQGLEQGIELGEARFGRLAETLLEAGRIEDLKRASTDAAFRDQLLQELGQ